MVHGYLMQLLLKECHQLSLQPHSTQYAWEKILQIHQ